jgi:hypothetical protein
MKASATTMSTAGELGVYEKGLSNMWTTKSKVNKEEL